MRRGLSSSQCCQGTVTVDRGSRGKVNELGRNGRTWKGTAGEGPRWAHRRRGAGWFREQRGEGISLGHVNPKGERNQEGGFPSTEWGTS